jgi:vacuolar-type H+-ATPase subunit E/Vma4
MSEKYKLCKCCKIILPINKFIKRCLKCNQCINQQPNTKEKVRLRQQKYYANNKAKVLEKAKNKYLENREEILAKAKDQYKQRCKKVENEDDELFHDCITSE